MFASITITIRRRRRKSLRCAPQAQSDEIRIEFQSAATSLWLMRIRFSTLWLLIWICSCVASSADTAKIFKVLPHYLDQQGKHSLSPSLYDRDAYQAFLRDNPDKRSALRFDINWKAKRSKSEQLVLRIELRGSGRDRRIQLFWNVLCGPHVSSAIGLPALDGEDYETMGSSWHGARVCGAGMNCWRSRNRFSGKPSTRRHGLTRLAMAP